MLTNRIYIPKSHRGIVKRLFRVQAAAVIETADETHEWLVSHYNNEAHNIQTFVFPNIDTKNYDELLQYLIKSKDELRRDQNKMSTQINFRYFLELFCQLHEYEYICGDRHVRLCDIIYDCFQISESYVRKLRWFARISWRHKKFTKLSLSLSQLVKKSKIINNMLKNRPDIALKWKEDLDDGMEADEELY